MKRNDRRIKDKEVLGHIMGAISFLPSYLLALYLIIRFNSPIFIVIVVFCQYFWLKGIDLIIAKYKEQLSNYQYLNNVVSDKDIIMLCGSMRFKDEFLKVAERFTLEGKIVIMTNLVTVNSDKEISDKLKKQLKQVNRLRIDLCDSLFIINKDGYVGFDTIDQIEYANYINKKVEYLEN